MKLSVLIPVYNEVRTIDDILRLVVAEKTDKEIIVVDDGSTDGTRDKLAAWDGKDGVRVILHEKNSGKGRAVRTAMEAARGEILVIQDADLEYDPTDYASLLRPIEAGRADVVFGSRFAGASEHRVQHFWHVQGNRLLTAISNVVTGLNVSDMATCYKVMRTEVLRSFRLESKGFGIDAEITAKVARGQFHVFEVPVSYFGRSKADGKKIRLKDGFAALTALVRHTYFPSAR